MVKLIKTTGRVFLLTLLLFSAIPVNANTAKGLYQQACNSCHGRNGEKTALGKARPLTTLNEAELIEALTLRRDGKIKGAGNQVKKRLSDEDIHRLAEYIPTLKTVKP